MDVPCHNMYMQGSLTFWCGSGGSSCILFGELCVSPLLTGLLQPIDFKLVSVYGTVPAYAVVGDGK